MAKVRLSQEEKTWFALSALVGLINSRKIFRYKNRLKILGVDRKQYDLIIDGRYDKLTKDEIMKATVCGITYFYLRDKNVRDKEAKN